MKFENQTVITIIETTEKVLADYFRKTVESRLINGNGSRYETSDPAVLVEALKKADWLEGTHPDLMPGCRAFTAKLPLLSAVGVVDLRWLFNRDDVTVELCDPKGTGNVTPQIRRCDVPGLDFTSVHYTWLIAGDEGGHEVVFTFHPGDPIRPSTLESREGLLHKTVTVKQARDMGLIYAKIVG